MALLLAGVRLHELTFRGFSSFLASVSQLLRYLGVPRRQVRLGYFGNWFVNSGGYFLKSPKLSEPSFELSARRSSLAATG